MDSDHRVQTQPGTAWSSLGQIPSVVLSAHGDIEYEEAAPTNTKSFAPCASVDPMPLYGKPSVTTILPSFSAAWSRQNHAV